MLKIIAGNDKTMQEASQALVEYTADQLVQQKCRAREECNRTMRTIERDTKKLEAEKAELEDKVTEHKTEIAKQKIALVEKEAELVGSKEENVNQAEEIALFRILLEQNNIKM